MGPVPPRYLFPRSCCRLPVRPLSQLLQEWDHGGGRGQRMMGCSCPPPVLPDTALEALPHPPPQPNLHVLSFHHPQDQIQKLKSNVDFLSLLLSFLPAAMAKSKQSACPAWPMATAANLFSLPPVFPVKSTLASLPVISLGGTFTWSVLPDSASRPQKGKPKPCQGTKSTCPLFLCFFHAPHQASRPQDLPTVCGRCHVCLCPGSSSMGNVLFLLWCLVTSTSPSRAAQVHPRPHCIHQNKNTPQAPSWHLLLGDTRA